MLRLPPLEMPFADPAECDDFGRAPTASALAELVASQQGVSSVVLLHGHPGCGRSSVLEMCRQYLLRRADVAYHGGPGPAVDGEVLLFDAPAAVAERRGLVGAMAAAAGAGPAADVPVSVLAAALKPYAAVLVDDLDRVPAKDFAELAAAMRMLRGCPGPVFVVVATDSSYESAVESETAAWTSTSGSSLAGYVDAVVYIPVVPESAWAPAIARAAAVAGEVGSEVAEAVSPIAGPVSRTASGPVSLVLLSTLRLASTLSLRPSMAPPSHSPQIRVMWMRAAWVATLLMWRTSMDRVVDAASPKEAMRIMLECAVDSYSVQVKEVAGRSALIRALSGRNAWPAHQLPKLMKDLSVPADIVAELSSELEGSAAEAGLCLGEEQLASAWLAARGVLGEPEDD